VCASIRLQPVRQSLSPIVIDSFVLVLFYMSMDDNLPFKVVRTNVHDEVLAHSINLPIGRAAYETAVRMYPRDVIEYRRGALVLASTNDKPAQEP
jgi:hypothetical protein